MDIFELRYTKADLAAAPQKARIFYLLAAGLSNDLQILTRQYAVAVKQWDDEIVLRAGFSAVAFLNLRLSCGRLYEGWELVEKRFKPISHDYEADLSQEGRDALKELRSYFAKPKSQNLIYMIRNKIGFHADYGIASNAFDAIPDDVAMADYIGHKIGHTLYYGVEQMHFQVIKALTGKTSDVDAFEIVMDEVRLVQKHFMTFVSAFARIFVSKHLAAAYSDLPNHKTTLTGLSGLEEIKIPYFVDLPFPPPPDGSS